MFIRDFMTPNPITVRPETAVEDIANLLLAHRINGVPVIDGEGRLLGVVTAEDLIHRGADERLDPRESLWKENFWVSFLSPKGAQRGKAEGRTAAEVMTTDVRRVEQMNTLFDISRLQITTHRQLVGLLLSAEFHWHFYQGIEALNAKLYIPGCLSLLTGIPTCFATSR